MDGHRRRRKPLNTRTGQWSLFNERNTPMYEIWTYNVTRRSRQGLPTQCGAAAFSNTTSRRSAGRITTIPTERQRSCLFKDQGLIHEITTSVSYVDKILWVATYFGDSRYDGRNWRNFLTKDSGLPSNFTNQVKAVDANRAWFSTDKGLAVLRRHELGSVPSGAGYGKAGDVRARWRRKGHTNRGG